MMRLALTKTDATPELTVTDEAVLREGVRDLLRRYP